MVGDARLIGSALAGIGVAILLIARGRIHPFLALLIGAILVGLGAGLPLADVIKAAEKGAGDILGGTGLVVALGLALGAMLHLSGGAAGLAAAALRRAGSRGAPWASLFASLVIGLPLFFETGLVLILPIVASAAATLAQAGREEPDAAKLRLVLPALAGLSTLHALVPPHPGPLVAVAALHANLARTIGYGLLVGLPTAIIAGPLIAPRLARGIRLSEVVPSAPVSDGPTPHPAIALLVVLAPVLLIAGGQGVALLPAPLAQSLAGLAAIGNPVMALTLACLIAMPLLFGPRLFRAATQDAIWEEAMRPAGTVLLAIGAGGALKQVLVTAGLATLLSRIAAESGLSPLLLAWGVAVAIRLATGSATVATITAAGIMPGVVAATGASPEWTVLAIGAGSIFFSHVNDPGFWLVKNYLGTDMRGTFRTWSVMELVVSVTGLILVLIGSHLL
jgi:GntP family gluconate:H+ symporter